MHVWSVVVSHCDNDPHEDIIGVFSSEAKALMQANMIADERFIMQNKFFWSSRDGNEDTWIEVSIHKLDTFVDRLGY